MRIAELESLRKEYPKGARVELIKMNDIQAPPIGTKGTVNVITLVCKNTIDERIEELVEKKGMVADALVDGKVSIDDINYLLS